jgi:hypothetical protein
MLNFGRGPSVADECKGARIPRERREAPNPFGCKLTGQALQLMVQATPTAGVRGDSPTVSADGRTVRAMSLGFRTVLLIVLALHALAAVTFRTSFEGHGK